MTDKFQKIIKILTFWNLSTIFMNYVNKTNTKKQKISQKNL